MRHCFGMLFILLFLLNTAFYSEVTEEREPPRELFDGFVKNNKIDELVLAELINRKIPPSETCSDEVFIRRVYLDTIGTLPNPQEVRSFLSSKNKNKNKRKNLIDLLLEKNEYADYWTMKWGDLLRIKSEFPSNLWPNAVQAYSRWVRDALRSNMPYDKFVRELLTSSGSNFRDPPVNFYRAFQERTPESLAENAALLFMGLRLKEAGIEEEKLQGMYAFFSKVGYKNTEEWKEEIVYFNSDGKPVLAAPLNGTALTIFPDKDPRIVFADWLTSKDNPWFAKSFVNRVFYWLFARGIVHEPDDMKADNKPWNEELLKYLEKEFIESKFDVKTVFRLILNSNTYQLSSKGNEWNSEYEEGFSHYKVRRLEAEPLLDEVCKIVGGFENYTSPIPEPFTELKNAKAVSIADGSITSPFLEMLGRPSRNTSFESERNSMPSVSQVQNFLNSSLIEKKINKSRFLQQLIDSKKDNLSILEELYIRILSRYPTEKEKEIALKYLASDVGTQEAKAVQKEQDKIKKPGVLITGEQGLKSAAVLVTEESKPKEKPPVKRTLAEWVFDVAWALINASEFILKH